MILYDLPWPAEALEAQGQTNVQMKVTLSYFIEPNPGERGWTQRHRYSSHGLRFAVKRSEENLNAFRSRVNRAAREDDEWYGTAGGDSGWLFGPIDSAIAAHFIQTCGKVRPPIWQLAMPSLSIRRVAGGAKSLRSREPIGEFATPW